ncbi:MAG: GNAT family N-acetyltransferase [Oscillospiraceae bacterium]|nr:GNAT family N-acetyltransferase [Oscillospiraceae bacterium]
MKTFSIYGKNYFGHYDSVRIACRAIVLRGGKLLMSYDTEKDRWMSPGGGMEEGEDPAACCLRESAEETGAVLDISGPVLEIDEYYENWRYVTYFFTGDIKGITARKLTETEIRIGLEPRWIPLEEIAQIFSGHADHEGTDEVRRGIYQREYMALCMLYPQVRTENWSGEIRRIDDELELVPYYPAEDITLQWYQDKELCRQVDNIELEYDLDMLRRMYNYLSVHGDCWYIRYNGALVGDVSLRESGEIAVVVSRPYQNKHIGRRCVAEIMKIAKEKGFSEVNAQIYSFNRQSQRMFESAGFRHTEGETWVKET